jgi:hypothetical protein
MEHALAYPKVTDDPPTDRLHGAELPWRPTDAGLRLPSRRFDLSSAGTNRHEAWLFDRYPLSVDANESVGSTEIDTQTHGNDGTDHR